MSPSSRPERCRNCQGFNCQGSTVRVPIFSQFYYFIAVVTHAFPLGCRGAGHADRGRGHAVGGLVSRGWGGRTGALPQVRQGHCGCDADRRPDGVGRRSDSDRRPGHLGSLQPDAAPRARFRSGRTVGYSPRPPAAAAGPLLAAPARRRAPDGAERQGRLEGPRLVVAGAGHEVSCWSSTMCALPARRCGSRRPRSEPVARRRWWPQWPPWRPRHRASPSRYQYDESASTLEQGGRAWRSR